LAQEFISATEVLSRESGAAHWRSNP